MRTATVVSPALSCATVSSRVGQSLLRQIERSGVSRAQLARAAPFDLAQFDARDGRVSHADVYTLCGLAVELTGDEALGLHWGETRAADWFAPTAPLVAHAETFGQALAAAQQFNVLLSDECCYRVMEGDRQVTIRCLHLAGSSLPVQRFVAEFMMVGFLNLARRFVGQASPLHVSAEYPAPAHRAEYTRLFGRNVRFGQRTTELAFDRALLQAPSQQRDPDIYDAMRAVAEQRMARLAHRVPYRARVRALLVEHGPYVTDMKAVARHAGMSIRSLRRRLSDEGTSFADVAREALESTARHHLGDQGLSIQETAIAMGFTDRTTFHRAFKRWTGITPSAYRASIGLSR